VVHSAPSECSSRRLLVTFAPDSERARPGLPLDVTDDELRAVLGRWLAVEDAGHGKASGADLAEVDRLIRAAGFDLARVSFASCRRIGSWYEFRLLRSVPWNLENK
jgi:hypothetical protein